MTCRHTTASPSIPLRKSTGSTATLIFTCLSFSPNQGPTHAIRAYMQLPFSHCLHLNLQQTGCVALYPGAPRSLDSWAPSRSFYCCSDLDDHACASYNRPSHIGSDCCDGLRANGPWRSLAGQTGTRRDTTRTQRILSPSPRLSGIFRICKRCSGLLSAHPYEKAGR